MCRPPHATFTRFRILLSRRQSPLLRPIVTIMRISSRSGSEGIKAVVHQDFDTINLGNLIVCGLLALPHGLLLLRWGCREHFVIGCWHSSGRDRGRYTRECWLSTLGVLHPGVPVMWNGHIRDLSPTAEGCMGGRLPNVTRLHWAQQE